MKKILIVTYYFPPLNNMAAKRYGYMCKYMQQCGYEPYILTTKSNEKAFLQAKLDLKLPLPQNHIMRVGQTGNTTNLTGALGFLTGLFKSGGLRTLDTQSVSWYEKVKEESIKGRFDDLKKFNAIIGTSPPFGNLMVASFLSRKYKIPYIAEIRDLISEYTEPGAKSSILFKKIDNIFERLILSRAKGIVAVTKGFKRILKNKYKKPIATVFNGYEKTSDCEYNNDEKMCIPTRGKEVKYLYYAGSLYEHRLDSMLLLVQALKEINQHKDIELLVRSIGPRELDIKAMKLIKELGMDDMCKILPAASEDVVRKEQKAAYANVLLGCLDSNNEALLTTIPGKTFELINEVQPVLAVGAKSSEIGDILKDSMKGCMCDTIEDIVSFFDKSDEYKGCLLYTSPSPRDCS